MLQSTVKEAISLGRPNTWEFKQFPPKRTRNSLSAIWTCHNYAGGTLAKLLPVSWRLPCQSHRFSSGRLKRAAMVMQHSIPLTLTLAGEPHVNHCTIVLVTFPVRFSWNSTSGITLCYAFLVLSSAFFSWPKGYFAACSCHTSCSWRLNFTSWWLSLLIPGIVIQTFYFFHTIQDQQMGGCKVATDSPPSHALCDRDACHIGDGEYERMLVHIRRPSATYAGQRKDASILKNDTQCDFSWPSTKNETFYSRVVLCVVLGRTSPATFLLLVLFVLLFRSFCSCTSHDDWDGSRWWGMNFTHGYLPLSRFNVLEREAVRDYWAIATCWVLGKDGEEGNKTAYGFVNSWQSFIWSDVMILDSFFGLQLKVVISLNLLSCAKARVTFIH